MEFFKKKRMLEYFVSDLANRYEVLADITTNEKDTLNVYLTTPKGIVQLFITSETEFSPFRYMLIGIGLIDSDEIVYRYDNLLTTEQDIQEQFEIVIEKLF